MRAFLLPCRGDANALARIVEPPAARQVPSTLEQPADAFTSITALTLWLKAQGDESSSPELRRLRAAVAVLAQKPKPKQEEVRPLCSAWSVQEKERQKNWPLPTLIAERGKRFLRRATVSAPEVSPLSWEVAQAARLERRPLLHSLAQPPVAQNSLHPSRPFRAGSPDH